MPRRGLGRSFSAVGAQAPAEPPKPKDGPLGMKFVPLPKATLYMGWYGSKDPAKKTEIKEDFEIAIHTVTQGQWQEVMGNNPSWFSRAGGTPRWESTWNTGRGLQTTNPERPRVAPSHSSSVIARPPFWDFTAERFGRPG